MAYVGNTPSRGQWRKLTDISGSFDGVTTTFTTSVPPGTSQYFVTAGTASQLIISLGGVIQEPDVNYSVSTNSITFVTPPAAGLSFFGILCGDALNTSVPSDGSITTAKLGGNLTVDLASGSASAPGLTFDSNTGLYSPGEDQVAVSTGGTGRLFIDSSGRVGIGTTSVQTRLHVKSGAANFTGGLFLEASASDNGTYLWHDGTKTVLGSSYVSSGSYTPLTFQTSDSERARIDTSGRLLVGTSSTSASATAVLQGFSGDATGASLFRLARGQATPGNGAELGYILFSDSTHVESAAITAFRDGGTWSGSSKPTRLVFSTCPDGSASPVERLRIANDGAVVIGKTSVDDTTAGFAWRASQYFSAVRSGGAPGYINRLTNDGVLLEFAQDSTTEGTISVSGTTVSYNGAHLSRWSQLPSGQKRTEILRGSVLSNIDEMCEWGDEDNEQLNRMKVSDVEGDKNVSGVFQAWDDDDDTYTNDFYCAMTGDFIIRIGAGVTVERGDLLMSAGDGTAKPQDDDIIRSKTIAKVTSTNVSCTYPDGSYCVPCVLMAC